MNRAFVVAMTEAGETADTLAGQLGVDPKTVQRWVNPGRPPRPRHRAQIAAILGRSVVELWPDVLKRREPVWFRPWVEIEREAVSLRAFQLAWVPGLLQTEAYARATVEGEALSPAKAEELAAARVGRQSLLRRPQPPQLVAVLDEGVLRRAVARDGAAAMREQCEHLAACAVLPGVQIHVVPAGTPVYAGLGGPFTLAELGDGARVAHVDSQVRAQIVAEADDVATLERRWARIVGEALPRAASLELIEKAAASWT